MTLAMNRFAPLWAYWGFIMGSVKRELQGKYRNSLPGVDSAFAYSIYLCAGSITWGLFSEITSRGQITFLENANLLKKLTFPRLCLPVVVTNALLNFVIVFGLFTLFLVLTGNFPGVAYLAVLPVLGILVAFSIGLGVTLGVLNVFFRDVGQFFGIFVQFWFWFTPIVYAPSVLPERVQTLMAWNPMAPLMAAFQGALVQGLWPNWASLWYPTLVALGLCAIGVRLFLRHAGDMVDEL